MQKPLLKADLEELDLGLEALDFHLVEMVAVEPLGGITERNNDPGVADRALGAGRLVGVVVGIEVTAGHPEVEVTAIAVDRLAAAHAVGRGDRVLAPGSGRRRRQQNTVSRQRLG